MQTETVADRPDPALRALVEAQWAHIADLVDTPSGLRRALTARPKRALVERAGQLPPVADWDGLTSVTRAIYGMPENRGRLARILDLVEDGERIVDIGCGHGTIGVRLLAARDPERYVGVELSERALEGFRGMADQNGIDPDAYELVVGAGETVGPDVVRDVKPSLVLILEVLEHVPDPGEIVAAAARELPPGADILISVPTLGYIEHDWGHVSVFDRARLERITREAGLHIHWVEMVMDQWMFLLLSPSPSPTPRIARLVGGETEPDAETDYFFRRIDVTDSSRVALGSLTTDRPGVTANARDGSATFESATAGRFGFTLYMPGMDVVRIDAQVESDGPLVSGQAQFRADGEVLETWELTEPELERLAEGKTLVFRRGFDGGRLHHNQHPSTTPQRFEFAVTPERPGATIRLRRAAYVRRLDNDTQPRARDFWV